MSGSRRLLLAAAVLVIGAGVLALLARHFERRPAPAAPPGALVRAAVVEASVAPIIIRGIGQVQAYNTDTVKSRVDGNVLAIHYQEGQPVARGALLVQIDPRPFQVQLEQARAALARDSAQLASARRDLSRYTMLVGPGLVTRQTYDTQRYTVRQFQAAIAADQAAIDQARLNLEYAAVRAPFSGRTGVRLVDLGNLVQTNQTSLVVITQMEPIFVTFTLPERNLGAVREAMLHGPVEVIAFDGDDERAIATGRLTVLDNTVDPSSGTVRLKAEFANQNEVLWPGEFVNAHVIVQQLEHAITVPLGAVQQGPDGSFVFRVTPANTAQVAPVELGQIEAGRALITHGLESGDRIVVEGGYGLTQGERLAVTNGAAARPRARVAAAGAQ